MADFDATGTTQAISLGQLGDPDASGPATIEVPMSIGSGESGGGSTRPTSGFLYPRGQG